MRKTEDAAHRRVRVGMVRCAVRAAYQRRNVRRDSGDRLAMVPTAGTRSGPSQRAYIANLLARAGRGEERDAYARLITDLEPELYAQAIRLAKRNQAQAARWLGVTHLKMREKLAQYGLHPGRDSSNSP